MKNILLILIWISLPFIAYNQQVCGLGGNQSWPGPECAPEQIVPFAFSYQGFVYDNQGEPLVNQDIVLRVLIEDSQYESLNFEEEHTTSTSASGLFRIIVGKGMQISNFLARVRWENFDKKLTIFLLDENLDEFKLLGKQEILTVPYAFVAAGPAVEGVNGAFGPQAPAGPTGPDGDQGEKGSEGRAGDQGEMGPQGTDGFGIMLMTGMEPTNQNIYVDDGTNTADGKPHIRYRLNNGSWIDI